MEDTKLKTIKPIKNFYAFLNSKRRGSGLILALVVALVGGAIGVLIFDVASSYLHTTSGQSRVYTDEIIAVEHIEQAKAAVMTANKGAGTVLRSKANDTIDKFDSKNKDITSTDTLIIYNDTYDNVTKGTVARNVEVKVWDAMYNPDRLNLDPNDPGSETISNLPPSFFISGGSGSGKSGNTYELYDKPEESSSGGAAGEDIYKTYGVYLVRVRIHQNNNGVKGNLIRTTEEAFAHRLPPATP